jgi:hypothetical protein
MSFRSRIARKSLLENACGPAICLAFCRFSSHTSHTAAMRAPLAASRFFINTCALPPVPMQPMFTVSFAGNAYFAAEAPMAAAFRKWRRCMIRPFLSWGRHSWRRASFLAGFSFA